MVSEYIIIPMLRVLLLCIPCTIFMYIIINIIISAYNRSTV